MRRDLGVILLLAGLLPMPCEAQFAFSGGVEYFRWEEDTAPSVTETGPLFAAGFEYFVPAEEGLVLGYRGKLWFGSVDYQGADLFTGAPIQSTTDYTGFSNELQVRFRNPGEGGRVIDLVVGLGYDVWERSLSSVQKEDFDVFYARLGFDTASPAPGSWSAGAGVKYPIRTREDAHLTEIGFDANPHLEPGRAVSLYAEIGYRVHQNWRLVGYYDGFRFTESNTVQVNEIAIGLGPVLLVQPESTLSVFGLKLEYRPR